MTTAAPATTPDNNEPINKLAKDIAGLIGRNKVDKAIQKFQKITSNDKQYAILMDRDALVLHRAARNGHMNTITVMLAGLSPDRRVTAITVTGNELKIPPLHEAARYDDADAITAMLAGLSPEQRLAAITVQYIPGNTPLHWAAIYGRVDAITTMLDGLSSDQRLAAITVANQNGSTPLHVAAYSGSMDTITTMLSGLDTAQCRDALFNEQHGAAIKLAQRYAADPQDTDARTALNTLISGVAALELSENDKKGLIIGILQEVGKRNPDAEIPAVAVPYLNITPKAGDYLQGLQSSFAQAATTTTTDPANGNDNTSEATIGNAGVYKHGVKRGFDGHPVSRKNDPGCNR